MMQKEHPALGRPVKEALSSLSADEKPPVIVETSAPMKNGQTRGSGTLRVIACRENTWIAARFLDEPPRRKEDA